MHFDYEEAWREDLFFRGHSRRQASQTGNLIVGRSRLLEANSIAGSMVSLSFSPRLEKTLMPLSSYGLCDAEITTPKS